MRVAITGATGHLGTNVMRACLDRGHVVRALVRDVTHKAIAGLPVEIETIDVLEHATLRPALSGCDAVIHLAARISITGDRDGLVAKTNIEGVRNVVKASVSAGISRLVHVSSIHAMQLEMAGETVDETCRLVGDSGFAYDRSKAAGERIVSEAVASGLNAVILRPSGILGPLDYTVSRANRMLLDFFSGKRRFLIPGGFDWVDARDVARAVVSALDRGSAGTQYLLSGHWQSLSDIAEACGTISAKPVRRITVPGRIAAVAAPVVEAASVISGTEPLFTREALAAIASNCRHCSSDRAIRELGFVARPLIETLRDSHEWFHEQQML
ncbi:MAG: NAD-dependent epimerase/dehydratase family protein [Rhizobiaceae bacterium]